jgi:hypothetical protein
MLINFNNGTPNPQERELIEQRIAQKFSGSSNAGKFILSFNDNKEAQAEITPVQLSDAHNQYQFLSDESQSKVLVAHRVVSPMLLGIKDNTGLGNNADEIKTASLLMDNTVIRPFQELLIDCFDNILAFNNIALNLYFITLQPLEFTDVDRSVQSDEEIEEETGVKMSLKKIDDKQVYETIEEAEAQAEKIGCKGYHEHKEGDKVWYMPCKSHEDVELTNQLNEFGESEEELLEKYELIDVSEVDYENEDLYDQKITELNTPEPSTLSKIVNLVRTGKAYPKRKSTQDGQTKQTGKEKFLVRYQYAPLKFEDDARKFCKAMVRAEKIYRKEDIIRMGKQPVNPGFGEGGSATYSIWLYKGGPNCKHKWYRKTYMLTQEGVKSEVTTGKAKSKGFKYPVNDKLVPVAPFDMKYRGYTKAYWDKMGFGKKK